MTTTGDVQGQHRTLTDDVATNRATPDAAASEKDIILDATWDSLLCTWNSMDYTWFGEWIETHGDGANDRDDASGGGMSGMTIGA